MKHVMARDIALNETLGKGSVIFIKGRSEGPKNRLYATYVKGYAEIQRGVIMYFLESNFHRIKLEDGRLRAVPVTFGGEEQLKKALSIKKGGGTISIVGHWNKTPWHKESVHHTSINSALRELEPRILDNNYLLESAQPDYNQAYRLVAIDLLRTIFFDEDRLDILSYSMDDFVNDAIQDADDESSTTSEWNAEIKVLLMDEKYDSLIESGAIKRIEKVELFFSSYLELSYTSDPGDYWNPPTYDVDAEVKSSELLGVYVDDESPRDEDLGADLVSLIAEVNRQIQKSSDLDIGQRIKAHLRANWYSKFF